MSLRAPSKRPPSPPASPGPSPKRIRIAHSAADARPLSDCPPGDPRTSPAAAVPSNADRMHHSMRPRAQCHTANEVCHPVQHDAPAPARMPQTLLSWTASHQHLRDQPQRASESVVVSASSRAHATPGDGGYISSPDLLASASPAHFSLSPSPSAAVSPMAFNFLSLPEAGPSTSRSTLPPAASSGVAYPLSALAGMPPRDPDVLSYLYEDLNIDLSDDVLSPFDFPAGDPLSELLGCESAVASPNPHSPIVRSVSRSSFGSSSYMPSSPPGDYPTPASDSSVTTPAPSEAAFGWLPELRHPLFGQEVPFDVQAKPKAELGHSYVQAFPGSAPLSPNAFLSYSMDDIYPPVPAAVPSIANASLTGARRHSEPANLAALQFPPLFQEQLAQILPPPSQLSTLPIADNLAPSSSTDTPSSIAPHQTQLPRPLEIKQPKPVRAYKPPILHGEYQYEPEKFARRHSAPVLPLRPLDVFSHLPLDVTEESVDEDADDEMMFDEVDDEFYDGDDVYDDMGEESLTEGFALEDSDMETSPCGDQGEALFDPQWSWFQPSANSSTSSQAWPEILSADFDWTTAFAGPVAQVLPPRPQAQGLQPL
ncbi:hypothetical protein C8Q79DRAFT_937106 [Trametes meyenii]|nr:hypothetical protein C8Q79DRAFT_937106 [Trametes meyenii]